MDDEDFDLEDAEGSSPGSQGHGWVQKQEDIPDPQTMPCFYGLVGSHP